MKQTLAYLGPEGTYTHEAALCLVKGRNGSPEAAQPWAQGISQLVPFPSISDILEAVADGSVALGVVPAENSIEGTVNLTLDMLAQDLALYIQSELILNINHHLLGFTAGLDKIHTVMSHYQALAQCRQFLKKQLPHASVVTKESTAKAVHLLTEQKQAGTAAIGSYAAHLRYQVPIIAPDIGDYPHNQTSFLVIGPQVLPSYPGVSSAPEETTNTKVAPKAWSTKTVRAQEDAGFKTASVPWKTTFVVFPHGNQPGELYKILAVFAQYQINLSKIISRPNKRRLGNYFFWLDCELAPDHPDYAAILNALGKESLSYKNLGSYPVYHSPKKKM